jgi:hypothetical protein
MFIKVCIQILFKSLNFEHVCKTIHRYIKIFIVPGPVCVKNHAQNVENSILLSPIIGLRNHKISQGELAILILLTLKMLQTCSIHIENFTNGRKKYNGMLWLIRDGAHHL